MRAARVVFALVVCVGLFLEAPLGLAAGGGGGGGGAGDYGGVSGSSTRSARSPAAIAKRQYKAGLRHKEKAWKLEAKAARAEDPGDREKLLAKADKAYRKALAAQSAAVKTDPMNHEAHNELGYALRKTGQVDEAIAAYDKALALDPAYYPAVEYRGEAYLALGQLEKAKTSYMTLFRNDRKLASQLMTAMDEWIESQPEGEDKAAFEGWVKERKSLAGLGDAQSGGDGRTW